MPHRPMPTRAQYQAGPPPRDLLLYDKSFKSTFRWVRRVIHEAMDKLEEMDLSPDLLGSVEIALAEALNNVVEHAYSANAPGNVHLTLRLKRGGILAEVRDQGRAMPMGRVPDGQVTQSEFQDRDAPEGGYGWHIIREIVQDLIYDRQDGENVLIFRLSLDPKLQ